MLISKAIADSAFSYIGQFLLIVPLALLMVGCGEMRRYDPEAELIRHQIKPGDTLYSIAFQYTVDYRVIAGWNNIPPPFQIFVGQYLNIIPKWDDKGYESLDTDDSPEYPVEVARTVDEKKGESKKSDSTSVAVVIPKPIKPRAPPLISEIKEPSKTSPIKQDSRPVTVKAINVANVPAVYNFKKGGKLIWSWPVIGKPRVMHAFNPKKLRKGININAKIGSSVIAAADGTVAYSGSGLRGYGNLIIIRHNKQFLSAYGHNRKLLVQVGDQVTKGMKIAEVGSTQKYGSILHFEIRKKGRPVDPIGYLPPRKPG